MGRFKEQEIEEVVEKHKDRIDNAFADFQQGLGTIKSGFQLLNQIKTDVAADPDLAQAEVDDIQGYIDGKMKGVLTYIVNNIDNAKLKTMLEDILGVTITIG